MELQLSDRVLMCSDCRKEFIFTAGEQLFFLEKQFKNDPKRCKPCKLRRYGMVNAANGTAPATAAPSRTETRTECSECKVETTVPFKPSQGRPVLCRLCFQKKNRAVAAASSASGLGSTVLQASADGMVHSTSQPTPLHLANLSPQEPQVDTAETVQALTSVSTNRQGHTLSLEAALVAAASMNAASDQSSVASVADLESIAHIEHQVTGNPGHIPLELLSAGEAPAELVGATAENSDA